MARLRMFRADASALAHWRASHQRAQRLAARRRLPDHVLEVFQTVYPWFALCLWLALLPLNQAATVLATSLALWPALFGALGAGAALGHWMHARALLAEAGELTAAPMEPAGAGPTKAAWAVDIQGLHFQYEHTHLPVLQDISMRIAPGQLVVVAGPSGGGKSTLLRLLLGFETPQAGEVRYDGQALAALDLARWRERIAVVKQDDRVDAASTLRSQISGLAPCGLEQVWEAARQAVLEDDIHAMPMGMQTIVEGNKISTGQEQRLMIARQLIRRPALLVLDEATNAIPEQAQTQLIANLRALGLTCVLVTHRESALALADQVFVIEGGRLSWSGSPQALAGEPRVLALLKAEQQIREGDS